MVDSVETTNIEIAIAVLFGSLMLALIGVFMFLMVIVYQKRKINAIREQQRLITQYEQAFLKAKVEIREETLKYVGQELHDNVGQVLSLIKLYLSRPDAQRKTDIKQLIEQYRNVCLVIFLFHVFVLCYFSGHLIGNQLFCFFGVFVFV